MQFAHPLTLATLTVLLATSPASACYGWKCEETASRERSRSYITNTHRQKVGTVEELD